MPQREQWKITLPLDVTREADRRRGKELSRSNYVEEALRYYHLMTLDPDNSGLRLDRLERE